jgi:hypothetical protein
MSFWKKYESEEERQAAEAQHARLKFAKKAGQAFGSTDWQKAVDFINAAIALDQDPAAAQKDGMLWRDQAVSILMLIRHKSNLKLHYILGALDPAALTELCRNDRVSFAAALEAKAAQRDTSALPEFLQAAGPAFSRADIDKALRAAVLNRRTYEAVDNGGFDDPSYKWYGFGGAVKNAGLLLQKGASLQNGNADLLIKAVEQGDIEMVKTLATGGADLLATGRKALALAEEKDSHLIAQFLKEQIAQRERFVKADDQTLVETKPLDGQGNSLKLVFNFEARRVTEIFSSPAVEGQQSAMVSHRFEDYAPQALQKAFDRLVSLGGRPRAPTAESPTQEIDKAPLQKPGAFAKTGAPAALAKTRRKGSGAGGRAQ